MTDVIRAADSNYVCPQCGPDPAGEEEHARTHHTFEGLFGCSPVTGEPVGRTTEEEVSDLRERLEDVATLFCSDHGGTFEWDPTHMHLTILDKSSEPLFTLHVELKQ
jgi:hypothetical protein